MDDGNFAFAALKEVWDVLDVSFRNPNEEADARDALSRLKQGSRPFGAYLVEFQRLQNLASIKDDKTLISYMRSGVANNLSICIGQQQVFEKEYTFDEFVALCKHCVIRLEWMRKVAPRETRNPNLNINNPIPRVTNPTLPRVFHDTRPHLANPTQNYNTLSDISNSRKPVKFQALNLQSINSSVANQEIKDLKAVLPKWLHHQASAFSKLESQELPPQIHSVRN